MKKWISVLLCVVLCLSAAVTVTAAPEEGMTERDIVMEAEKKADGTIIVWLNDETGAAMPLWIAYLEIDGEVVKTLDVDAEGVATIEYDFPAEPKTVTCRSYSGEYGNVKFIGSTVDLSALVYDGTPAATTASTTVTEAPQDTTAADTETTASSETTQPTEATSSTSTSADQGALSIAPLTTAVNAEGRVAVGVDVDNGIVKASQMSPEAFVMESRMWMDPSQYERLVSSTDASLHLELTLHAEAGSKSNLIAAKNNSGGTAADFSAYADSEVTGFAMNTALVYVDGDLRAPLDVGDGVYRIEMPLPACFDSCERLAIAICTVDGLGPFVEVEKADSLIIDFERFQTFAIVGFGHATAAGSSWLDWLLWGGIVLVVLGALVLVFVTFRRGQSSKIVEAADDEDSPRHILIKPVAEESIETDPVLSPEEIAQKVLMDFDEQTDLTNSEREQFRAKEPTQENAFDAVSAESVTAAEQIADHQMESIRRTVEQAQAPQTTDKDVSVDDLLNELDDLLDQ